MQNVISFHVLQIGEVEKCLSNGVSYCKDFPFASEPLPLCRLRAIGLKGRGYDLPGGTLHKASFGTNGIQNPLAGQTAVTSPDRQPSRTPAPASKPPKDFK